MVSMAVWAFLPACRLLCRSSCTAKEKQKSRIMRKDQDAGTRQGANLFADPSMQHQMEGGDKQLQHTASQVIHSAGTKRWLNTGQVCNSYRRCMCSCESNGRVMKSRKEFKCQ